MSDPVLKRIPLASIRENPVALRSVNRQTDEYLGLVESVKKDGVLNAILVREIPSAEGSPQQYGLIDGLHRYTASLDAGRPDIPAQVINMTDAQVMEAQLIGNVHKVETRPVEYSKHLQRILAGNPLMTMSELADKLSKSSAWLSERLNLLKLSKDVQPLVDEGKINLSNAYALSKLPEEEQANFIDRAMSMAPTEFSPTVLARKKEIDTAKRQGRDAKPSEFVPVPHLQRLADMKGELEGGKLGPVLVRKAGVTTAEEGFALAIKWALHMDEESIAAAKSKDDARKKDLEAKKAKAAIERAENRAKEAAETAARLQTAGA